jgi:hypothetical protein
MYIHYLFYIAKVMETAGKAKEKRIFSCDCWVVSDMVHFHDSFPFTKSYQE